MPGLRRKLNERNRFFIIELPRSFNVPDGVVAHIDDIVLPVSWRTTDERNHKWHIACACGGALREANFTFDSKNYDGAAFATNLEAEFTTAIDGFAVEPDFMCTYNTLEKPTHYKHTRYQKCYSEKCIAIVLRLIY